MKFLLVLLLAATVPHQATLYYQSSECTNTSPCTLTVYRTVCPTPTTCPAFNHSWTKVTFGTSSSNAKPTGTTWVVTDTNSSLQDNTTYAYVGILAWRANPGQTSGPSPVWSGTTSGGSSNVPAKPTVGTGNSVN